MMKKLAIGTIKFIFTAACVVLIAASLLSFCTDDFWYGSLCVHHEYGAWVTISETTCTEKGIKERTCKVCGTKNIMEYTAYGHEYISETVKEATVHEEGEIEYTCFRCGDCYTKSTPKLEATFTSFFVAPTGDDPSTGYVLYVCDQDQTYTYKEPLTFTTKVVAPDCYNEGYTVYICNEGDYSYISDYTGTTEHDWQMMSNYDATCEDSGGTTWICKNCNKSKVELTDPLGHDYIKDESKSYDATCNESGYIAGTCSRCGKVMNEDMPPLGHAYGEWSLIISPSFEITGLLERICENDPSHTETLVLPVLNDNDYYYKVVTEPTCTEKGKAYYHFGKSGADFNFEVELEPLRHSYEWEIITEPTFTEEGELKGVCTRNSRHTVFIVLPVLDFSGEKYILSEEPSCEEEKSIDFTYIWSGDYENETQEIIFTLDVTAEHEYEDGVCLNCGVEAPDYSPEQTPTPTPAPEADPTQE